MSPLLSALFIIFLIMGCSSKGEDESYSTKDTSRQRQKLYERVVEDRAKKAPKIRKDGGKSEVMREKQLAVADACLKKHTSCSEKCSDSSCENTCLKALSICEKDLPIELKTIK